MTIDDFMCPNIISDQDQVFYSIFLLHNLITDFWHTKVWPAHTA